MSNPKRDLDSMEQRRRKGMRLLARGIPQAKVARLCGVSRVSVHRWARHRLAAKRGAWKRRMLGRRPKLSAIQRRALERALVRGAQANGFPNDRWTLPRVATLIQNKYRVKIHPGHAWRLLSRLGWSFQSHNSQAIRRNRAAISWRSKSMWSKIG